MTYVTPEQFGPPDVRLVGLALWVRGRTNPDAQDPWDGNWLNVIAHCTDVGASVWTEGPILDTRNVFAFHAGLETLYRTLSGEAVLASYEPHVKVRVSASNSRGVLQVHVDITPDHNRQEHRFEFDADQTYLPPLIAQLARVMETFPIRGVRS